MPGRAVNYETKQDETVAPKTLHGVKPIQALLIQCADHEGRTQVLLGFEVEPGDIRTLPEKTWNQLGRPSSWLMEQINEQYYGLNKGVTAPVERPAQKKPAVPVKMDGAV